MELCKLRYMFDQSTLLTRPSVTVLKDVIPYNLTSFVPIIIVGTVGAPAVLSRRQQEEIAA